MNCYLVYGKTLCSEEDFSHSLASTNSPAEIYFHIKRKRESFDFDGLDLILVHPLQSTEPKIKVFRKNSFFRIIYHGIATYDINGNDITCFPADQVNQRFLHFHFLGPILSFWLELQGLLIMHGSAIKHQDKAVLFLADSHEGKSTLISQFLSMGKAIVSDDLVPIHWLKNSPVISAGYPTVRLWPQLVDHFFLNGHGSQQMYPYKNKLIVKVDEKPGNYSADNLPLGSIYVLKRNKYKSAFDLKINTLTSKNAAIMLVNFSYAKLSMISAGIQPRRLAEIAKIVGQVKVKELNYTSGLDFLPDVCDGIINDVSKTV